MLNVLPYYESQVLRPPKHVSSSVAGVMVSIVAFQAVDPGSIPGPRIFLHGEGTRGLIWTVCLLSLVVEHSLCKRKVGGSIPPVGCFFFCPGTKIMQRHRRDLNSGGQSPIDF